MFWSFLYAFLRIEYWIDKLLKFWYLWLIVLSIVLSLYLWDQILNEVKDTLLILSWITWVFTIVIFIRMIVLIKQSWLLFEIIFRRTDRTIDKIEEALEERNLKWIVNHYCIVFYWFIQTIFFLWLSYLIHIYFFYLVEDSFLKEFLVNFSYLMLIFLSFWTFVWILTSLFNCFFRKNKNSD